MHVAFDWFRSPESPQTLARFRIAVALFGLLKLLTVGGYLFEVYGPYGLVQWAITKAGQLPGLPHLGDVALALGRLGLSIEQAVWLLLGLFTLSLILLALGLFTRAAAAAAWVLDFLFLQAGGGLVYGMDMFAHMALFYCLIMPCGVALSLDARRAGSPAGPSIAAGVTRRMLQVHLALVYFSAGFEKALGEHWWNGEAIWRSLTMPTFRQFDFGWMADFPWLPIGVGWTTVAVEILYPVFIWPNATRRWWLAATIGMHIGIAVFLGLWLFAAIMIVLNLGAFGFPSQTAPE